MNQVHYIWPTIFPFPKKDWEDDIKGSELPTFPPRRCVGQTLNLTFVTQTYILPTIVFGTRSVAFLWVLVLTRTAGKTQEVFKVRRTVRVLIQLYCTYIIPKQEPQWYGVVEWMGRVGPRRRVGWVVSSYTSKLPRKYCVASFVLSSSEKESFLSVGRVDECPPTHPPIRSSFVPSSRTWTDRSSP